jgi:hypothetical protein
MKPGEELGEDMQDEVRTDQSQRYKYASIYGCLFKLGEDMQDEVRTDQPQRYKYASIYGCHRFSSVAVALANVDDIFFLFLTAVSLVFTGGVKSGETAEGYGGEGGGGGGRGGGRGVIFGR